MVCIVQISRIDVQVTEPMYPTELTKLTVANAEYPAGKAMLMCTYSDVSAQVCNFSTNSNKFICKIFIADSVQEIYLKGLLVLLDFGFFCCYHGWKIA